MPTEKIKKKTKTKPKAGSKSSKEVVKAHDVEVLGKDPFVAIHNEVQSLTENTSLDTAKNLSQNIDCNYFRLGGILSRINEEGWWGDWGFSSFNVFVQAELGMAPRKSLYLVSIYNHLVEAGIPYEKVKNLGWTKLRELAPILDSENVDEWVETAESMNNIQLIEEIKESKKSDTEVEEKKPNDIKSKVFKLHDDQREVIEEAIESAKLKCKTEYDAVALEAICLEYLGKPVVKKEKKKEVEEKEKKEPVEDYPNEVVFEEVSEDEDLFEEEEELDF